MFIKCKFTHPVAFGDSIFPSFNTEFRDIQSINQFDDVYNTIKHDFIAWIDGYQGSKSGWVFNEIKQTNVIQLKTQTMIGSSYFELPDSIKKNKYIVNIQNKDNKCFLWCVISYFLNPKTNPDKIEEQLHNSEINQTKLNNPHRPKQYQEYENQINMEGIKYPVKLNDKTLNKFENNNPNIAINVFALKNPNELKSIFQKYVSKFNFERRYVIDILYVEKYTDDYEEYQSHYCLITNINSILAKNHHKAYLCRRCFHRFTSQNALVKHNELCGKKPLSIPILPKEGDNYLEFKNHHFQHKLPFVFYCDFEAINIQVSKQTSEKTQTLFEQKPLSYGYKLISNYPEIIKPCTEMYTGKDSIKTFLNSIIDKYESIWKNCPNEELCLTEEEEIKQDKARKCYMCGVRFKNTQDNNRMKVREHDHWTGFYRGPACQSCNTKEGKASKTIPVVFHNGSKYDFHFLIEELVNIKDNKNKVEVCMEHIIQN
jgi:hypothetical protein